MALPQGPLYRALGQRIREARKAKNLRQAQLASAVGLTRTSITNIETGRQPVAVHILCGIADALGIPVTNLLPAASKSEISAQAAQQIQHLKADTQQWVTRILQTPKTQETRDGTQILTRKEASD